MSTVALIARQTFEYRGRLLAEGECFSVPPAEGAALLYQRKAIDPKSSGVRVPDKSSRKPASKPATREIETNDLVPESPRTDDTSDADDDETPRRGRRRYRRRDMVPEP